MRLHRVSHKIEQDAPISKKNLEENTPVGFRARKVRKSTSRGINLLKIMQVCLLIFLSLIALRFALNDQNNKPVRPEVNHFATSLSPYVVPGYRTVPHGRSACQIRTSPISERECEKRTFSAERKFNNTLQERKLDLQELQKQHDKAVFVSEGIMLGIRPLRLFNYKKALESAEQMIIKSNYSFQNPEETTVLIKNLHHILFEGLPLEGQPGVYRTNWMAVTELTPDGTPMRDKLLRKAEQIGSMRDIAILQESFLKFNDGFFVGLSRLNTEELKVFKKLMTICPPPEQIEYEMLKFVHSLKDLASNGTSAIDLACFAHCELGRIHAFPDGNGRLGRIVVNALLKRGGEKELVFPDINLYGRASLEEMKNPGAFKRYVIQAIAWTKANSQALDLEVNEI